MPAAAGPVRELGCHRPAGTSDAPLGVAMIAYSETTAWVVTCVSGVTTGVILGAETSVSLEAFVAVTLIIALAIVVCARLLRSPTE
jgi:hypothetical protein